MDDCSCGGCDDLDVAFGRHAMIDSMEWWAIGTRLVDGGSWRLEDVKYSSKEQASAAMYKRSINEQHISFLVYHIKAINK